MAITSAWYDGPWTVQDWAQNVAFIGSAPYGVINFDSWRVSIKNGADRTVNIAAGSGWGRGVMDQSSAVEAVQVPTIASGSRWDLIVARRNWATTGASATGASGKGLTYFTYVQGSSAKAIPGSRNQNPGTLDDQPIALVRVVAGQSNIQEVVDLRVWVGPGGMTAADDLVRNYCGWPGSSVEIKGTLWQRRYNLVGVAEWVRPVEEWLKNNTVTTPRLRLTAINDASPTSTGHAFQIGPDNGLNLAFDVNEVVPRDNGVSSNFNIDGTATAQQGTLAASLIRKDYLEQQLGGNDKTWTQINGRGGFRSGWGDSTSYIRFRKRHGFTQFYISTIRTGADIAVGASGDIQNIELVTAPLGARPTVWWHPLGPGASGRAVFGTIDSTGLVAISSVAGSSPIRTGELIQMSGTYISE